MKIAWLKFAFCIIDDSFIYSHIFILYNYFCSALGLPNENNWPGVTLLPNYNKISYKVGTKINLRSKLFSNNSNNMSSFSLSDCGYELLLSMLTLNPNKRINSNDIINHNYFKEFPLKILKKRTPEGKSISI